MKVAILGTVGVPGRYGGFETLAENLVRFHGTATTSISLSVWCSSVASTTKSEKFESAALRYVPLNANGVQSIPYDMWGLAQAAWTRHDKIILLGVSGALALPLIRLMSRAQIFTNIDGIEWQRHKWKGLARLVLRASEWAAVQFSHEVIADNQGIAEHVSVTYKKDCHVIAYGGDHALHHTGPVVSPSGLPADYALALCRIEPENNIHTILEAWVQVDKPLVFVGNWSNSAYGRDLKAHYAGVSNLYLLDSIYDPEELYAVRAGASIYVHGHSAGGTNPALVEMMHFGVPVLAHGCVFNRYTTEEKARYFETPDDLAYEARNLLPDEAESIGANMREIAQRRYTWNQIGQAYFSLLEHNYV